MLEARMSVTATPFWSGTARPHLVRAGRFVCMGDYDTRRTGAARSVPGWRSPDRLARNRASRRLTLSANSRAMVAAWSSSAASRRAARWANSPSSSHRNMARKYRRAASVGLEPLRQASGAAVCAGDCGRSGLRGHVGEGQQVGGQAAGLPAGQAKARLVLAVLDEHRDHGLDGIHGAVRADLEGDRQAAM